MLGDVSKNDKWERSEMNAVPAKIDVTKIIADHYRTFGARDGGGRWKDILLFYLIPTLIVATYVLLWWRKCVEGLQDKCWMSSLTVTAIFIPLALTMLVNLHGLAKSAEGQKENNVRLRRKLSANISYMVLVAIVFIVCKITVDIFQWSGTVYAACLYVFLFSHLCLTLMMVVKRFYTMFTRFDGD